jgi:hypothetical protein
LASSSEGKRLFAGVNGHAEYLRTSSSTPETVDRVVPVDQVADDNSSTTFIRGETLNLAADLRTVRPGDKLEIPYELTVSESMQDFWQSVRGMNTHTLVACIQQDD